MYAVHSTTSSWWALQEDVVVIAEEWQEKAKSVWKNEIANFYAIDGETMQLAVHNERNVHLVSDRLFCVFCFLRGDDVRTTYFMAIKHCEIQQQIAVGRAFLYWQLVTSHTLTITE